MSLSVSSHLAITRAAHSLVDQNTISFSIEESSSPLTLWEQAGFCNAEGWLTFVPGFEPKPLNTEGQKKFADLLSKQVTIGRRQVSFKDYLEKVCERFPGHQLYLRGSYATYVIEPLQELKGLIDAFIEKHPETAELMQAGYDRLLKTAQPLQEPNDADWALISDIETLPDDLGFIKGKLILVNAELAEIDFLTAKNETFANLNPARKNDLTLTEDPIVIASLNGSLDLLVGSPMVSPCLFSYDNRYIPFGIDTPPFALNGNYWQSTLDYALGIIRLEPRHTLDFRALLVAIKHLSQGRIWISSEVDYARALNKFAQECPFDLLYSAIVSKMPKKEPDSLCYLMNLLSLIDENDALWTKMRPLIAGALDISEKVAFSYQQLANELYGFDRLPFLKKAIVSFNSDLSISIKKTGWLHPEKLPNPPQQGPYADWAIETAALHQKNPLSPIPGSIYEILFSLLELKSLSEEEIQAIQRQLDWHEPLTPSRVLDKLVAEGNLIQFLPLWLNVNHQGNWEKTLRQLLGIVKLKHRKESIKTHFERLIPSHTDREELYLAAFSLNLFKPDAPAMQLLHEAFSSYDGERLALFLQSLAPLIRQKSWITTIWIDSYLSGKISEECLRKRIPIWFASNLAEEQKEALALDLFNRCQVELFTDESVTTMFRHLKNPLDQERWLQTLLTAWPVNRFLNLIQALPEREISARLLKEKLRCLLYENRMQEFIDLLTHTALCKELNISPEDFEIPLKGALQDLSRKPQEVVAMTKQVFGKDSKRIPNALLQFFYTSVVAEPHDYLEELKAHSSWLIDTFKDDGEKQHTLFCIFRSYHIPADPPPSLLLFMSTQDPSHIELEWGLSLVKCRGGDALFIPVLKGILICKAAPLFADWLNQVFPRLKNAQRSELLQLIQGRKNALLALFQYILDQPIRNPQPFVDLLLHALLSIPEIIETIDLKRVKHLQGHTGKPLQRFFASPHLFSRFVKEYLFLKPIDSALLELSINQAEAFNLLTLFIAEAPSLRKLPLLKSPKYMPLKRTGAECYLYQTTGSHEWLYEMPGACDHPIVNQLSIIRLVNQGIDFSKDHEARAFLFRRIDDIIALRRQQKEQWINYPSIGECLTKIFLTKLHGSVNDLPEGLFEWFNAIGIDPSQTVLCRSSMLQITVLKGPPHIAETALFHLFDLLPDIPDVDFQLMEGLIFSFSLNPRLSAKPLRDKLNQLMDQGSSSDAKKMTLLSHFLNLILLNRLEGHEEERLHCCLSIFKVAVEAKIDLSQPSYAHQIIKCIALNFFVLNGQSLMIKDEWMKIVNKTRTHELPVQNKLRCLAQLSEQIFPHATALSFSGILVMVAHELTSIIQDLKGGYDQTQPLLMRLLEKTTSNPHFINSTIQAETLIPLLPHLKAPSLIYLHLLILMRKNLEMPEGEYLKYLKIIDEIGLINHALDIYLLRGDQTAAESAKRIFLFSMKKKIGLSIRLKQFDKVIQTYTKAEKSLEECLDLVVETFRAFEKPLKEEQQVLFMQIIDQYRPSLPRD